MYLRLYLAVQPWPVLLTLNSYFIYIVESTNCNLQHLYCSLRMLLLPINLFFLICKFYFYLYLLIFINFYCCSITVALITLPHYSPLLYPLPTSPIQSSPLLSLSMGPLYMCLNLTLPLLFSLFLTPSSLATVSLFLISMSVVLFCSLVCFVD